MSWASFHVVEVMSSPKFHLKSVGYLAAIQSFNQETDVLMLTTNLLKKVRFQIARWLGLKCIAGSDVDGAGHCTGSQWYLAHCHDGLGKRSRARTPQDAEPFASVHPKARCRSIVQDHVEISGHCPAGCNSTAGAFRRL